MNSSVFKFLHEYSFDPSKINRLVVTAYLYSLDIQECKIPLIQEFTINTDDIEFASVLHFLSLHRFTDVEELIRIFEFVVSPEEKIVTGAVYTPKAIREYIVDECLRERELNSVTVCDPACGCGGFLYTAAEYIHRFTGKSYATIFRENIFGLDIQSYAVERTQILLALLAIASGDGTDCQFNIHCGNALGFKWQSANGSDLRFDTVVGNPPYVCSRNIDVESRKLLSMWEVSESGHPDLYIPFFQIGFESLSPCGKLGFITMNSFFKSLNGRALRQYFSTNAVDLHIFDFGDRQQFESRSTYTCVCFAQHSSTPKVNYARINSIEDAARVEITSVAYSLLDYTDGWNLQNYEILNVIERTGNKFGSLFKTKTGVATLKNSVYIFQSVDEDQDNYFFNRDGLHAVEKGICREIINSNKFTRDIDIEDIKEFIIFPYTHDESGHAKIVPEVELRTIYPNAYRYLKSQRAVLGTRDKGKKSYQTWYAYGRNQSLDLFEYKLFFPHITPNIPYCQLSEDQHLLFYNGICAVSTNESELKILQKILHSSVFWFYVIHSSKPYGSGYYSLARNYIKNFGIPEFTLEERNFLLTETNQYTVNTFLEVKYGFQLPAGAELDEVGRQQLEVV